LPPLKDEYADKWELFIFRTRPEPAGQELCTGFTEEPGCDVVDCLKGMIEELPSCVLLMHVDLFHDFALACKAAEVKLDSYHYIGKIYTS